jgi:Immunity protein 70
MEELYAGALPATRVRQARGELEVVERDLRGYLPTDVVWDIKNPAAQPPWGEEVAASITSLADYFWTADGKPLIEVLNVALRSAEERGLGMIIS